jgi:hypothetical protein
VDTPALVTIVDDDELVLGGDVNVEVGKPHRSGGSGLSTRAFGWAMRDSNPRPLRCERSALTN